MGIRKHSRFGRINREGTGDGDPNAGGGSGAGQSGQGQGGDDWAPPSREEFEALQKRLTKVNGEAAKYRTRLKAATQAGADGGDGEDGDEGTPKPKAPTAKPAAPKPDPAVAQLKRVAINSAIKSELAAAGFQNATKDRIARALRMIDASAIELDADGEVDGLDEQIETLKADFPEFFTAATEGGQGGKPKAPRAARVSTAGKPSAGEDKGSADRTKVSASRWADLALGRTS